MRQRGQRAGPAAPLREHLPGLQQLLGRLKLALGIDHLGATQPFGLGLLGDGALSPSGTVGICRSP